MNDLKKKETIKGQRGLGKAVGEELTLVEWSLVAALKK